MNATPRRPRPAGVDPGFRIGAVSRLTGVSSHALRVWERRYGPMASGRSSGGYRLYTEQDVERIRLIKELLDHDHAIAEIARLPLEQLRTIEGRLPSPPPEGEGGGARADGASLSALARDRFLDAISTIDLDRAGRILSGAASSHDPVVFLRDVAVPVLQAIGARWEAGTFTVAQEHAASGVVREQLASILRSLQPRAAAPTAVFTTLEGERHELGAMVAAIVAVHAGLRVLYLGPSTPVDDLADLVRRSEAVLVGISVVSAPDPTVGRELGRLRRLLPRSVTLAVGGRSAPRRLPDDVHETRDLAALQRVIDHVRLAGTTLGGARATRRPS